MVADRERFPTTHASAIAGARSDDERERRAAWDAIVGAYWRPAYAHLRLRWRLDRDDAADRTQSFFERAMEKSFFDGFDPERARFRTFFRVCLDRFASNEARDARREKRGGGAQSLDFDAAEAEIAAAGGSAEDAFDRAWRRALFSAAIEELREACAARGKDAAWRAFERYDLTEGERPTYDALARELGVPATTITNHLAWARRELRAILHARLAAITSGPDELAAEVRALLGEG